MNHSEMVENGGEKAERFGDVEVAFLKTQMLTRIATVSKEYQPDVAPVGFEFDGTYFYISGYDVEKTRKFKNVKSGNRKVALTIDELVSVNPWRPRGIRVLGEADIVEHEGRMGKAKYLRISPKISWSWGIEGLPLKEGERMLRRTFE
ncbi:MAG: PPOX class F420-dependent oxidoreductase [Nitrososphaerales archaeon]